MSLLSDFRSPELVQRLAASISEMVGSRAFNIMEVCGGQTHTIYKYKLRELLPECLRLISGPGCPVCVTPIEYIDKAVSLGLDHGARIFTFGDLMRVPGTRMNLERAVAEGADVEAVYSPFHALEAARACPDRQVVFLGIGFETTLPGIGLVIREAAREGLENFSVLLSAKRVPPVLDFVLASGEARVDGFITPGHVTSIIGMGAYDGLCSKYRVPMAVGGFEPVDLLGAIHALVSELVVDGVSNLNAYTRAVSHEGNRRAQDVLDAVFEVRDGVFRGLGLVPSGGFSICKSFEAFDADRQFDISVESHEPKGCICGEILCGVKRPADCALFGSVCSPDRPVGACMVSNEGACNAAFIYE